MIAKAAGMVLELLKGCPAVHGMPQQIMKQAGHMAAWNLKQGMVRSKAWSLPSHKGELLHTLLLEILEWAQTPNPRCWDHQTLRVSCSQQTPAKKGGEQC